MYNWIDRAIYHRIVELITTTFYNLKSDVLQLSAKWCYISKNILSVSKLYFKIA